MPTKLVLQVDGNLLLVRMRNIKDVQVSPPPDHLPSGVFRGVQLAG